MKALVFALIFAFVFTSFTPEKSACLKPEELKLYTQFMKYRKQKGLHLIPLSASLTQVAKMHTYDLAENQPIKGACNMHSWSKKGKWKACCYTSNHKQAECMWNKPRELTDYTGDGFEIAAYLPNGPTAENALEGWKSSPGHHQVMINKGSWKNMNWQAVGVGITGDYAVIWFGIVKDENAIPVACD